MRAVFINYSHPNFPHVSSMRVRYFAESLARRGHQIVLLIKSLSDQDRPKDPEQVREELLLHDWNGPYLLPCPPVEDPWLRSIREGNLPSPVRKVGVVYYLWQRGGIFSDWVQGTRRYWRILAKVFKPNITWGSFGNSSVIEVTRGLAKFVGVPWVMDIKDDWEHGVPGLLRILLARRFSDAAAVTVNSNFLLNRSAKWFPHESTVIYSGVPPEAMIEETDMDLNGKFRLVMIGGSGEKMGLIPFLTGLRFWLGKASSHADAGVEFIYAGNDHPIVHKAAKILEDVCKIKIYSYLPIEEMLRLCKAASVNAYIWNPIVFHHKIVELLCCRRPIIVFPGENEETVALATSVKGKLYVCSDQSALVSALNEIRPLSPEGIRFGDLHLLKNFTWDAQSSNLLNVLQRIVAGR